RIPRSLADHGTSAWIAPAAVFRRHELALVETAAALAQPLDNRFTLDGRAFDARDGAERAGGSQHAITAIRDEVAGDEGQLLVGADGNPRQTCERDAQHVPLAGRVDLDARDRNQFGRHSG